jgi:nucleotide-binding universal stress UspA family protein
VDRRRVFFKSLEPEGGASEVGLSIKHYAQSNDIDLVVMGSRGALRALRRRW